MATYRILGLVKIFGYGPYRRLLPRYLNEEDATIPQTPVKKSQLNPV